MFTKLELINCLKKFFNENAQKYNIEIAYLYGSWARGFPRNDSDIDIGIVFEDKFFPDDKLFEYITDIEFCLSSKINLEVSVLPVYRDFRKPILYYNVIILGISLYIGNYIEYVKIREEAIFQMEDFSIFGIAWQFQIAKKNMMEVLSD